MSEKEVSSLQTINLFDKLFEHTTENLPHQCHSYRKNQELHQLESHLYRESYSPIICDTCECEVKAYSREIGSYDEWDTETICKDDWLKLPIRPKRLDELRNQISAAKDAEYKLGIYHFRNTPQWHITELMQTIDVPKLVAREPKDVVYGESAVKKIREKYDMEKDQS